VLSAVLGTSRPPLWRGIVVAGALLIVEASVVDLLTHIASHGTFGLVLLLGVLVISPGWGLGLAVVMNLAGAAVYVSLHVGASAPSWRPTSPRWWRSQSFSRLRVGRRARRSGPLACSRS
jgi:hypothetical protein